jgi:membrane protease YdiL (CAAX protease family)
MLLVGVFVLVLGIFVGSGLVQLMATMLLGDRSAAVMAGGSGLSGYELGVFRLLSGLGNFFGWGLPGLFWALLAGRQLPRLGLNVRPSPRTLLFTGLAMVMALPIMQALMLSPKVFSFGSWTALSEWIEREEVSRYGTIKMLIATPAVGDLLFNLLVIALIPAFSEELFFRGGLQRTLGRMMPAHAAVWVSALLFSALHFQFLGFLPRVLLGAALGYAYQRSGSLWVSIGAHFIYNGLNLVIGFLAVRGVFPIELVEPDFQFPWWMVISSAVMAVATLWLGWRRPPTVQ